MRPISALCAALAVAIPATLSAETVGEAEYMNHRATGHGASGSGDGLFAELMTVPVPDLTHI